MQIDFKSNIENLDKANADFMEAYQASVTLLDIVKANSSINSEEVDQLIDNIINKPNSLDIITGSMDEIFNTGSLYLIKDPILRKQLSNWSFKYSDTDDDIVIYKDYLFNLFIPSLTKRVNLRNTSIPTFF